MQSAHAAQPDPLRSPRRGCTVFAVRLYNVDVLEKVKQNLTHPTLSERWAEIQTHEICADNSDDARRIATEHFPTSEGFVILDVVETPVN